MKLGKMLSYMSPAFGMATGMGLGKVMPYLSPGLGAAMGKGPLGDMFGGHHGGGEQAQMPQPAMPGAMGDAHGQPMQQGQPSAPASFGQPGMFGGSPQGGDMMARIRQMMMSQYGGGY